MKKLMQKSLEGKVGLRKLLKSRPTNPGTTEEVKEAAPVPAKQTYREPRNAYDYYNMLMAEDDIDRYPLPKRRYE